NSLTIGPIAKRRKGFFDIHLQQNKSIWPSDLEATSGTATGLNKGLYSLIYGTVCTSKAKGSFSQNTETLYTATRTVTLVRVRCGMRKGTMTTATTTFATRRGMVTVTAMAVGVDKDFDVAAIRGVIESLR